MLSLAYHLYYVFNLHHVKAKAAQAAKTKVCVFRYERSNKRTFVGLFFTSKDAIASAISDRFINSMTARSQSTTHQHFAGEGLYKNLI
jgi:hypothetical protein